MDWILFELSRTYAHPVFSLHNSCKILFYVRSERVCVGESLIHVNPHSKSSFDLRASSFFVGVVTNK